MRLKKTVAAGSISFEFLIQGCEAERLIEEFNEYLLNRVEFHNEHEECLPLEIMQMKIESLYEINEETGEERVIIKK